MRRAFAALLVAFAAGCNGFGPPATHPGASTPEEKAVEKYVLDNADDPRSVEFDRWGPDLPAEQCWQRLKDAADAAEADLARQDAEDRAKWEQGKKGHDAKQAAYDAALARAHEAAMKLEKWKEDHKGDSPEGAPLPPADLVQAAGVPDTEPEPYPPFVPRPRLTPPLESLSDADRGGVVVRCRYRSANRVGAKELRDELFVVRKDGAVAALPLVRGADDWPDRIGPGRAVLTK